jgi:hypothetical protein
MPKDLQTNDLSSQKTDNQVVKKRKRSYIKTKAPKLEEAYHFIYGLVMRCMGREEMMNTVMETYQVSKDTAYNYILEVYRRLKEQRSRYLDDILDQHLAAYNNVIANGKFHERLMAMSQKEKLLRFHDPVGTQVTQYNYNIKNVIQQINVEHLTTEEIKEILYGKTDT